MLGAGQSSSKHALPSGPTGKQRSMGMKPGEAGCLGSLCPMGDQGWQNNEDRVGWRVFWL